VLLAEVAATSQAVAATRARNAKIARLAELVRRLGPDEVALGVGYLMAAARQGRIGVGWATLRAVDATPAAHPTMTIIELDSTLDELARVSGTGSGARRAEILQRLLARATVDEQRLIRSVLMGELRQGALDGLLVEAVAAAAEVPPDLARRAYMLTGDLGETARLALASGTDALRSVRLEVLRPVRPMLASTSATVTEAMAQMGTASVEHKLDGARIQVHRDGDEVRIFTRSLADVSNRLPEVVAIARGLPARSFVLDGESLTLDADARPRAAARRRGRPARRTVGHAADRARTGRRAVPDHRDRHRQPSGC
jgi:DNA ligase-1